MDKASEPAVKEKPVSVLVSVELYEQLTLAAECNDRSLAAEVRVRLKASLTWMPVP